MATSKYTELPDGSVLIGDRKYRTGFLKADWDILGDKNEHVSQHRLLLRLKREGNLHEGGKIYHYTNVAGFKGIIDTNGFWASDCRFMNDTEELYHGVQLIADIVSKFEDRERLPGFKKILADTVDAIPQPYQNPSLITCFSLDRDSLEQWRGYGPSGGICIGLNDDNFSPDIAPVLVGPDLLLHRVNYKNRAKLVHVISIVRRFKIQYQLDMQAMPDWPEDHDRNYMEHLSSALAYISLLFKNNSFRSEQEVRYIITPKNADRFTDGLEFRTSPFGIIPYVNTAGYSPKAKRLPISEVIVGPSPHQKIIASSIETFLHAKSYNDNLVKLSKVPFRSF